MVVNNSDRAARPVDVDVRTGPSTDGATRFRPGHGWHELALQVLLVGCAVLFYFGVRGLTEGSVATAVANGHRIVDFEQRLGIGIEPAQQETFAEHRVLTTAANWVYIWGHWPVIVATLLFLHHAHRLQYLLLRNAMFVSGAIGLCIFATFPVAPPRLLGTGFVDTVTELSTSYRVLQPPALVNRYAAMPSLHVGWNLLVGLALLRVARRRRWKLLAVVASSAMVVAVVVTANHYVVDAVAGIVVASVGYWIARAITLPLAMLDPHPGLLDEAHVVDDHAVDAVTIEPLDGLDVGHAPGEDTATRAQPPDGRFGQQPAVDDRSVDLRAAGHPQEQRELEAVARRSHRLDVGPVGDASEDPPGLGRDDETA